MAHKLVRVSQKDCQALLEPFLIALGNAKNGEGLRIIVGPPGLKGRIDLASKVMKKAFEEFCGCKVEVE